MKEPLIGRGPHYQLEHHRSHFRENTLRLYQSALDIFSKEFGDSQIGEISETILFDRVAEGKRPQTNRLRYDRRAALGIPAKILH